MHQLKQNWIYVQDLRKVEGGTNQDKLKQRLIELGTQFYNSPWNLNALYQDVLVCMEQLNWIQFPENSQQIVEHIDLELTQETENAIEELVVNAEDKRKKFGQQIFEQVGYYQKKNYSEIDRSRQASARSKRS